MEKLFHPLFLATPKPMIRDPLGVATPRLKTTALYYSLRWAFLIIPKI
jgi:hypothetical protein